MDFVSLATSERNWARGFFAPLRWFFQAMWVITSFIRSASTPYFFAYEGASSENIAGAVSSDSVPSFAGVGMTRPENPESLSFSTPTAITQS